MTPKPQITRARRLRQSANLPEQRAWSALRTLRKHGFPVRRQHPIGPYVVDFAIVRERLVIEIDGGIHKLDEIALCDSERDEFLRKERWRILRIEASHAMDEDYLLKRVTDFLGL
ncbi:endonuclease domain-containing protein [Hyphococcus sp.]|uniref:endonuclease domain-containing protein n=1 Tax=Hyphococcus sp. TaxID=2038636 RepID=UPI003D0E4E55